MEGATILIIAMSKAAACRRRQSKEKQGEELGRQEKAKLTVTVDVGYSAAGSSGPKLDLSILRPQQQGHQRTRLHYLIGQLFWV